MPCSPGLQAFILRSPHFHFPFPGPWYCFCLSPFLSLTTYPVSSFSGITLSSDYSLFSFILYFELLPCSQSMLPSLTFFEFGLLYLLPLPFPFSIRSLLAQWVPPTLLLAPNFSLNLFCASFNDTSTLCSSLLSPVTVPSVESFCCLCVVCTVSSSSDAQTWQEQAPKPQRWCIWSFTLKLAFRNSKIKLLRKPCSALHWYVLNLWSFL